MNKKLLISLLASTIFLSFSPCFAKENTAMYKIPRIYEFVDELPKTISGKIRRVEIREKDKGKDIEKIKQDF